LKYIFSSISKSSLFSSFSVYIGASLFNAAIPFLLLPVFTRYLSPLDYGIISMFTILCSFFMPFVGLSTASVLGREYFNKDKIKFDLYVGNVFIILGTSLVPIVLLLLFFSSFISDLSEVPEKAVWFVVVYSFFSFILSVTLTLWQVQSKAKQYGVFQIGQTILNILLSIILVVSLNYGWEGRVIAQLVAVVIFGCLGFYILYKNNFINLKYNKAYCVDALKFGIPLIPHTLGAIIISLSDRFFITNMVGIEATGLYAVGYSIGNIIGFIEHSFNLAYVPWLFGRLSSNEESIKVKIVKYTYYYFIVILILVGLLYLFTPFIFGVLIDEKFSDARIFVFWIALSFAFSGMYKMVANYIFYVKKTHILAWITLASSILNLILNYFLIKAYGAVGAAMAAAIVSFCFFIFTWILSNAVYKMPWAITKLNNL